MSQVASRRLLILPFLILAACGQPNPDSPGSGAVPEFVVVYTSLEETQLAPVYEAFVAANGIRIQQISAKYDRLLEMMHDRQRQPAADVFLATGSAVLWNAAAEDIFRPTYSEEIQESVPPQFRDPEKLYTAIAINANAIVLDAKRAGDLLPTAYESLAEEQWLGKLCLTSSSRPENIGWISLLIARHGIREGEMIVRRLIANLALPVFDDLPALMIAVESGRCGAAIADLQLAAKQLSGHADTGISIMMPSASQGGAQVEIVGAGVTRHAANPEGAVRFLEWLTSHEGQQRVAESGLGIPMSGSAQWLSEQGHVKSLSPAEINVTQLGALSRDAINLAERAHYP